MDNSEAPGAARRLVVVPVSPAQARRVADGETLPGPVRAFAAGPALAATFGLGDPAGEEAELAALQVAGVAGLARHGVRLVLTAQVAPGAVQGVDPAEAANGGLLLRELPPGAVEAFFTDAVTPRDVALAGAAAGAAAGCDVDAAWPLPAVAALLAQAPLGWHDVTELDGWLSAR